MTIALTILHVLVSLFIIGVVLLQSGKGAEMGASFGSGASGSLFGATGSANFLSRSTAVAATIFFVSTLALAYFGNLRGSASQGASILEQSASAPVAASVPSAPASGAALIPSK